eukprot:g6976.t1
MSCGVRTVVLSPAFAVRLADDSAPAARADPDLRAAVDRCTRDSLLRFRQYTRGEDTEPVSADDDGTDGALASGPAAALAQLTVRVLTEAGANSHKQLNSDESYEMQVVVGGSTATASVTARTLWGAMYGMEAFTQLVEYSAPDGRHVIRNATVHVADTPRFRWRGIMVDTANHFLPMPVLLETVDAMAANRLNTLHLHLVDSYSFPFASAARPELARAGAWGGPGPAARTYNASALRALVAHARARGVRVVPELDMPGHAYAWGLGEPELVADTCPQDLRQDLGDVNVVPLNPTADATYAVVAALLAEFRAIFADEFLHFGADEVQYACWNNSAAIRAWMGARNVTSLAGLETYFWSRVRGRGREGGGGGGGGGRGGAGGRATAGANTSTASRAAVFWQEAWQRVPAALDARDLVEVWDSDDNPAIVADVVRAGHRALVADGWYLDRQVPVANQTGWFWLDTWRHMYGRDPTAGLGLSAAEQRMVLGGEACMWSEQVDVSTFSARVWPRACAVAERLWSAASVVDVADASSRLMVHRCRMSAKGVQVGPIWADSCTLLDGGARAVQA